MVSAWAEHGDSSRKSPWSNGRREQEMYEFLEERWDAKRTSLLISQLRTLKKESIFMPSFLDVQTLRAYCEHVES